MRLEREKLYQWDMNQKLIVDDETIKTVHFTNRVMEEALVVEVKQGFAYIPNILLQSAWDIKAYGFTSDYTKVEITLNVVAKNKPNDYLYQETEIVNFGRLQEIYDNILANDAKIQDAANQSTQNLRDLLNMMGNNIATLTEGKIPIEQIPATATQEIFTVESAAELTALDAQRGDLAELIELVNGEKTITKTWQCLGDAANKDNWIVWGTSYAVQAGNASRAAAATTADKINGMRFITMDYSDFQNAVKDKDTLYGVYMEA